MVVFCFSQWWSAHVFLLVFIAKQKSSRKLVVIRAERGGADDGGDQVAEGHRGSGAEVARFSPGALR